MTNKSKATAATAATDPAPPPPTAANDNAALAQARTVDPLAGLDGDALAYDGLGEISSEDLKIPLLTINFKGKLKTGRAVAPDVYFDTIDEVAHDEVEAVFYALHKTNRWSEFNQETERSDTRCRSYDRVTGTMDDGTKRPCLNCPDTKWYTTTDDKGKEKRTRNCNVVYNVYGVYRATGVPFVTRYQKTALPVIQSHMQKHHIGRRRLPGNKRANMPFYSFAVKLRAQLASEKATYAVPIIEMVLQLPDAEILEHAANTRDLVQSDIFQRVIDAADKTGDGTAEAPDTSFDPNKWAAGEGEDFVPATTTDGAAS